MQIHNTEKFFYDLAEAKKRNGKAPTQKFIGSGYVADWLNMEASLNIYETLKPELLNAAPGVYDFAAGIWLVVQEYKTQSYGQKKYEAHQEHHDVQIVLDGEEITAAYRASRWSTEGFNDDTAFAISPRPQYHFDEKCQRVIRYGEILNADGTFGFFPAGILHAPGILIHGKGPQAVKKVVFKVQRDYLRYLQFGRHPSYNMHMEELQTQLKSGPAR